MITLEGCVKFLWWDHLTGLPLPSAALSFCPLWATAYDMSSVIQLTDVGGHEVHEWSLYQVT